MILFVLLAQPSSQGDTNVTLDDERLKDDVPKGLQKVELDLDDALFLEFEDKEEPATPPEPAEDVDPLASEAKHTADRAEEKPIWQRAWFLGIIGILFLLAGGIGTYVLTKAPVVVPSVTETAAPEPEPEETKPEETSHPERQFSLKPFVVEYQQGSKTRFLTYTFAIPYSNSILHHELETRTIHVRDAVYRQLKNSDLAFLDNPDNAEKVKNSTIAVINTVLQTGQISSIHIAEYVVH